MQTNYSLKALNSLQVEAKAKYFLEVKSTQDLVDLPEEPLFILGSGCNTLFTKDWPGIVLQNKIGHRQVLTESKDKIKIKLGSGEDWHSVVTWAVENNWSGIENMAYIPGTVGAAVTGNIAAYGQAFDNVAVEVEAWDLNTKSLKIFSKKECEFEYRRSIFQTKLKGQYFITSATLELSKTAQFATNYHSRRESLQQELEKINPQGNYSVRDVYQAVINIRKQKLPDWHIVGTAGSFFKNPFVTKEKLQDLQAEIKELQAYPTTGMEYPKDYDADLVKIPAGRLLEELGWKNRRIGNVGTFTNHALVVVNYGGTGQEVFEFSEMMRKDVKKNYDIDLEYEVQIV